jgi:signal transduction histidine kinase/HPt (histidine-containing phosphotransfer) domain-containing protein
MPSLRPKLLHLEDDPLEVTLLDLRWREVAQLHAIPRLLEACAWLRHNPVDAVLLDLTLPDRLGPDCVAELRRQQPELSLVVLNAFQAPHWEEECLRLGALEVFRKDDPALADFPRFWRRLLARRKALQGEREKGEHSERLVRTVAHEVRTPLNGLIGFARMLSATSLTALQRDYLESIEESSQTLLQLVNDLLDRSRNHAGRLQVKNTPFLLRDCLHSVVQSLQALADSNGLTLDLSLDELVPARVRGDEMRLGQVLTNLIGNAIKFTLQGGIHLRCSLVDSLAPAEQPTWIRFSVRDSGRGIAPEFRDSIFKPFAQGKGEDERCGSGLGLMLCRQLVEAMGGEIDYRSRVGEGSEFWFLLPLVALPLPTQAGTGEPRVLVVDDDRICRKLACALLQEMKVAAVEAEGLRQALELCSVHRFDLLLIDLGLADGDGRSLLTELRARGCQAPALALSGQVDPLVQLEACQSGFADYLIKPVDPDLLQQQLKHWLPPAAVLDPTRLEILRRLARRPGAGGSVREMVQAFVENCPADLQQLRQAIQQGDTAEVSRRAHYFKGATATMGVLAAATRLQRIEEDPAGAAALEAGLERELLEAFEPLAQFVKSLESGRTAC